MKIDQIPWRNPRGMGFSLDFIPAVAVAKAFGGKDDGGGDTPSRQQRRRAQARQAQKKLLKQHPELAVAKVEAKIDRQNLLAQSKAAPKLSQAAATEESSGAQAMFVKALPWIIGGAVVVGLVIFLKKRKSK